VEGRLLYTLASDHHKRHGGVLRTPQDLNVFAAYGRPEIVRHFRVHYDPAKHNTGMLWFGDQGVVITKLDTSGAKVAHQYSNRFLSPGTFSWTSQNRMGTNNEAGRTVVDHAARGLTLHLFVQPKSHEPAIYMGVADVAAANGVGPMRVVLNLNRRTPDVVLDELGCTDGWRRTAKSTNAGLEDH
jgi:hypothetical protein